MALIFEYEKDLESGAYPFICHEPDSTIYNYYINNNLAKDRHSIAPLGQYQSFAFGKEESHITQKTVSKIGVKNFPRIGGIGFFKDKFSGVYNILIPIHDDNRELLSPATLEMVDNEDGTLTFTIIPPLDVEYFCYRIVLDNAGFTYEHITYELEITVKKPDVIGQYNIYCIGYVNEGEYVSTNSNIITLEVTEGREDFRPESPFTSGSQEGDFYTKDQVDQMIQAIQDSIGSIGQYLDVINGEEV